MQAEMVELVDKVSRELVAHDGGEVDATLEGVLAGARAAVGRPCLAAVRLAEQERAHGDDAVAELELLSARLGEGPGPDAVAGGHRVHVDDLSLAPPAWSRFTPAALHAGIRTICAFPLAGRRGRSAGTLTLAASTPGALAGPTLHAAGLVAAYATVALDRAQRIEELQAALRSRDVIGTAKGILVERFAVDEDEAFAMLRRSSQHTNLKLRDVAQWLVGETTGPDAPPSGHNGVPDA